MCASYLPWLTLFLRHPYHLRAWDRLVFSKEIQHIAWLRNEREKGSVHFEIFYIVFASS